MVKTSDSSLDPRDDELLAEVLVSGQPSTDELVAYLLDSSEISDARRSEIARLLESSPAFRDRASMLQRFMEARAAARPDSAAEARSPMLLGAPAAAASIPLRGDGGIPSSRAAEVSRPTPSRLPGWVVLALGVGGVVLAGAVLSGYFALRQAMARSEAAIARAELGEARQGATLLVQALASARGAAAGTDVAALERGLDDTDARWETVSELLRTSGDDQALASAAELIAAYNGICSGWLDRVRVGAHPTVASTPCALALAHVRALESGTPLPSVDP